MSNVLIPLRFPRTAPVFNMGLSQSAALRRKRSDSPSTDTDILPSNSRRKRRKSTRARCECGCHKTPSTSGDTKDSGPRRSIRNKQHAGYNLRVLPSSSITPDYRPSQRSSTPNPSQGQNHGVVSHEQQQVFDLAIAARTALEAEHTHLMRLVEEEELIVQTIKEEALNVYARLQAAHLQVGDVREYLHLEGFMPVEREHGIPLGTGAASDPPSNPPSLPSPPSLSYPPTRSATRSLSPVHSDAGSDLL